MKLSTVYAKYPDLILLHGISRIGARDKVERSLHTRISALNENGQDSYLIRINHGFANWGDTGIIIREADILDAKNDDLGWDPKLHTPYPSHSELEDRINCISIMNFTNYYSDVVINNIEYSALYFNRHTPLSDYSYEEIKEVASNYELPVFFIDQISGQIFRTVWMDKERKYQALPGLIRSDII
jgi:hypothetical protein